MKEAESEGVSLEEGLRVRLPPRLLLTLRDWPSEAEIESDMILLGEELSRSSLELLVWL